jgi:hypothetical protein
VIPLPPRSRTFKSASPARQRACTKFEASAGPGRRNHTFIGDSEREPGDTGLRGLSQQCAQEIGCMHRNMASAAGCRHPASRWPCLANQGECTTLVTLAWSGGAAGSAHQEHGAISRHKRLPRPAVARSASACLTVLNRSQRLATLRRCASLPFAVGRGPFIVFAGKPAIYILRQKCTK